MSKNKIGAFVALGAAFIYSGIGFIVANMKTNSVPVIAGTLIVTGIIILIATAVSGAP